MATLEIVADIATIICGAIATCFTAYFGAIEIRRIITTPRFVVGILPDIYECISLEKLGRPASAPEHKWHFNQKYLASKYENVSSGWLKRIIILINKLIKVNNNEHSHCMVNSQRIYVGQNGYVSLFVLIQNQGGRVADRFTLIIRFDNQDIQITDLDLGTQELISIFTVRPHEFNKEKYLDKLTHPILLKKWEELETLAPVLSLAGYLESDSAEIIRVEMKVPAALERCRIYFDVDCPTEYWKERRFAQDIRLIY